MKTKTKISVLSLLLLTGCGPKTTESEPVSPSETTTSSDTTISSSLPTESQGSEIAPVTDATEIVSILNDLKGKSYALSYEIGGNQFEDIIRDDYFFLGYLSTGSLLLNTLSDEVKYAYDFKIENGKVALRGQSYDEEYRNQEQTKLRKVNHLADLTLAEGDLYPIQSQANHYTIEEKEIVTIISNQLDFVGISKAEVYLENGDVVFELLAYDAVEESYYVPEGGKVKLSKIGTAKIDAVDSFLASYQRPTDTLEGKGENLFTKVKYTSAIYDFILDDNIAYLQSSEKLILLLLLLCNKKLLSVTDDTALTWVELCDNEFNLLILILREVSLISV